MICPFFTFILLLECPLGSFLTRGLLVLSIFLLPIIVISHVTIGRVVKDAKLSLYIFICRFLGKENV